MAALDPAAAPSPPSAVFQHVVRSELAEAAGDFTLARQELEAAQVTDTTPRAVVLRYIQAFEIDNAKINVNGGAIAPRPSARRDGGDDPRHRARRVGAHPNKSTALVTLCIGGGMGTATIIERV